MLLPNNEELASLLKTLELAGFKPLLSKEDDYQKIKVYVENDFKYCELRGIVFAFKTIFEIYLLLEDLGLYCPTTPSTSIRLSNKKQEAVATV